MFKTRLQELCRTREWDLPNYTISREGPDHDPRFQATVTVNILAYHSHNLCTSSEEAENHAAQVAFLQLSSFPGLSCSSSCVSSYASAGVTSLETKEENEAPQLNETAQVVKDDNRFTNIQHLLKNRLQIFAQKRRLTLPKYSCECEGPPHAIRFRCKVIIDAQTFQSLEFFSTIKEAECAAAKLALMSLSPNEVQEDNCVYKNLLQELAQQQGYLLPVYTTSSFGETHKPTFVSTVEIDGEVFMGQQARRKKQAEFSAAKAAYTILKDGKLSQSTILDSPACQRQETPKHSFSAASVNDYQTDNFGSEHRHKRVHGDHPPRPGDLISSSHQPSDCSII